MAFCEGDAAIDERLGIAGALICVGNASVARPLISGAMPTAVRCAGVIASSQARPWQSRWSHSVHGYDDTPCCRIGCVQSDAVSVLAPVEHHRAGLRMGEGSGGYEHEACDHQPAPAGEVGEGFVVGHSPRIQPRLQQRREAGRYNCKQSACIRNNARICSALT